MLIFMNCSYCELKRSRKVGILYLKDEIVKSLIKDFNLSPLTQRYVYMISRVSQCLSPRPNWDPPPPLPQASVSALGPKGDTLACGWGGREGSNSDDWRKSLSKPIALSTLCPLWKKGGNVGRSHSSHSFAPPYFFPSKLCSIVFWWRSLRCSYIMDAIFHGTKWDKILVRLCL